MKKISKKKKKKKFWRTMKNSKWPMKKSFFKNYFFLFCQNVCFFYIEILPAYLFINIAGTIFQIIWWWKKNFIKRRKTFYILKY